MRRFPAPFLSVLMLGMVSQVAQVVLLRELLMVFHGNELSIGIILSAWMAWVGVGSALGAIVAERTGRVLSVLMLNAAALLPLLAATVLIIRGLRGFFDVLPGAYLSLPDIFVSSFAVMAPVCILIGMQFVLLAKLWRQSDRAEDTSGAGKTYIGEAVGNIFGGVAFTLVMVHYLNSFQSVVLAGMLMAAAVLWTGRRVAGVSEQARAPVRAVLTGLLIAGGGSILLLGQVDDWAHGIQWRHLAPDHQLVATHQSKYGNIAIARRDDQLSFFRSGHLMFAAAGQDTEVPHFEEQEAAVFAHFAMTQHTEPKSVLLIGGGLRGTLGAIIEHPVKRVDYVELDEVLTRNARAHVSEATLAALREPRVRLVHADGRVFVKEADQHYDLVIVDVPDPATAVLNRYYTREFFEQVRRLLNPDGVLVIGAVSTAGLRGTAVANRNATIQHTLGSVFATVLPVGEHFLIFFASDAADQISADPEELQRRYLERGVDTDSFSRHHFHLLLEESQLRRVNWILRNHGRTTDAHLAPPPSAPFRPAAVAQQQEDQADLPPVNARFFINSDFKPIGYFQPAPLKELAARIDAANIDLKGFDAGFYRDVCGGELAPVLESLRLLKRAGVHLEITNLLIPTLNDDIGSIRRMCAWIRDELGADVPLHFARFYPLYRLANLPQTPVSSLDRARETALEEGLRYVYVSRVTGHAGENTYCPNCGEVVIGRVGFIIDEVNLSAGQCSHCGEAIPGRWA